MVSLLDGDGIWKGRVAWTLLVVWGSRGVTCGTRPPRSWVMPTVERAGRYEDAAALAPGEPSLDGAIAEWVRATVAASLDGAQLAVGKGVAGTPVPKGANRACVRRVMRKPWFLGG